LLIDACLKDAKKLNLNGVAVQVSKGSWMASPELFEKNGFEKVEEKSWSVIMVKIIKKAPNPGFRNWDD